MSRVLVTGGSGFIGSHVVDALIAAGHEPRIIDLRSSPHHDSHEVDCVVADLLDRRALTRAMKGCDAVIHLAAAADVGEVVEDPVGSEQANARGTVAVLEAAREAKLQRVIYCSTIWVYGDAVGQVTEDTPLELPRHLYTASKLAGEMYCTSYAELYGVPFTILRFGIPYGPRARPAAVIPRFVEQALDGEPLTLAGDGSQSRRFVYVEDLADGVVRALRPEAENRIYNLVGDSSVTIREVAETVRSEVAPVEIVHTPGRTGDFDGAEISSRRAADELGWRASTSFSEGVARYLVWHRAVSEPAEPKPARSREGRAVPAIDLASALFASLVGIAIPALIASGVHPLGDERLHSVAFIVLMVVGATIAVPMRRGGRGGAIAIVAGLGAVLLALPWTRHALDLAPPGMGGVIFGLLGAMMAVATIAATRRLAGARAAPETAI